MKLSFSFIGNWTSSARSFLKETRAETKKVVWPSKQYVIAATVVILFILLIGGAYILFLDSVFSKLFAYLMGIYKG